jgi:sec-independent protein translocase protein TatA
MSMPGGMELVIIFLVILLVFGAKRIPEIASGLGKGIREFKDATSDIKKEMTVPVPPAPQQITQANVPPPVYVPPTPVAQPVVVTGPQDATAPPDAPAPPQMTGDGPRP